MSKPLIVAFGYEARSGKGECASYLFGKYRETHNVLYTSFAKALRREIHEAVAETMLQGRCAPQEALRLICEGVNVPYDANALVDDLNPYGKQRKLQQYWGTEYRRAQCPTYWVDKVGAEIARVQPDVVLIDDMRFPNEMDWVEAQGGCPICVIRPSVGLDGDAAKHVSEVALKDRFFEYAIHNDSTLEKLYGRVDALFSYLMSKHTTE